MRHFVKLASGFDTVPAMAQIDAHPELWNAYPNRRGGPSPHRETDDMWLRYRHPSELHGPEDFATEHVSVFYPAWDVLTELHPIADAMIDLIRPSRIGGYLMTRIPSGGRVYPHHDRGTFHAEFYDTKVWIPLRANDRCVNRVEDEDVVWKTGDAWSHDNLKIHSVENNGATERVCLILCFKR